MAVSAVFYDNFVLSCLKGDIDLDTATVKLMLCTASYTPNKATHVFKSSVNNEVTGTAYTAGGATVSGVTTALASAVVKITADDVQWADSTIANARYAVLYISTGSDATSRLIGYIDFGENVSSTAADFDVAWDDTDGVGTFTVAAAA